MTGMRQEVARPRRMPTPMAAAPIMPAIEAYSGSTLLDGGEKMRKCDWASLGFFNYTAGILPAAQQMPKYLYTLYTLYLFLNLLCILVYSRVYSHTHAYFIQ